MKIPDLVEQSYYSIMGTFHYLIPFRPPQSKIMK